MASFKNEKGLTLIELLITISVLAVVSAIALPVINNVVTSSNSNAYNQTLKDAQAFIDKYSKGGVVVYDGLRTLAGYVDKDGDNQIEADEKVDTLTLDDKYSISVTGSASEGGSYTAGGVTAASITSSATGGSDQSASTQTVLNAGHMGWGSSHYITNGTITMMGSPTNTTLPSTSSDGTADAYNAITALKVGDQLVYTGLPDGTKTFTITSITKTWTSGNGGGMWNIGIDDATTTWWGTGPGTSTDDSSVTVTFIFK